MSDQEGKGGENLGRIFPPSKFVSDVRYMHDNYRQINCPICGEDDFGYQHFEDGTPYTEDGGDAYKAGWEGRGDLLKIPFWGECGHCWTLCIGFHKGQSLIFAEEGDHSETPMNAEWAKYYKGEEEE